MHAWKNDCCPRRSPRWQSSPNLEIASAGEFEVDGIVDDVGYGRRADAAKIAFMVALCVGTSQVQVTG